MKLVLQLIFLVFPFCPSSKGDAGKTETENSVDSQTKGRTLVLFTQRLTLIDDIQ